MHSHSTHGQSWGWRKWHIKERQLRSSLDRGYRGNNKLLFDAILFWQLVKVAWELVQLYFGINKWNSWIQLADSSSASHIKNSACRTDHSPHYIYGWRVELGISAPTWEPHKLLFPNYEAVHLQIYFLFFNTKTWWTALVSLPLSLTDFLGETLHVPFFLKLFPKNFCLLHKIPIKYIDVCGLGMLLLGSVSCCLGLII